MINSIRLKTIPTSLCEDKQPRHPELSRGTRDTCRRSLPNIISSMLILLILVPVLNAGTPPKELTGVIDHFMNMDSTSLRIEQVIDWRFSGKNDSIAFQIDIKAGQNFHLNLAAFGLEIYVTQNEMMTINHLRQQILYENASPDALLKQLFGQISFSL